MDVGNGAPGLTDTALLWRCSRTGGGMLGVSGIRGVSVNVSGFRNPDKL